MVAFLDLYDLWPADFLERTRAALSVNPEAEAATCDRIVIDFADLSTDWKSSFELTANATLYLLRHGGALGQASLFRVEPIQRLGGYPEEIPTGHASALFLRLSL